MKPYSVLIAHQSTIPHYRVNFYEQLHTIKSDFWDFEVVVDRSKEKRNMIFNDNIDITKLNFGIKYTDTTFIRHNGKKIVYQNFLGDVLKYDLIVVENAINNLSYPLAQFVQLFGKKVVYWGHGRDLSTRGKESYSKKILEKLKLGLVKKSDGFFAYTESVHEYLTLENYKKPIFTIDNTIDILGNRKVYEKHKKGSHKITKKLVFTGRLNKARLMSFVLDSFLELNLLDPTFELNIVGGGDQHYIDLIKCYQSKANIKYHGPILNNKDLAKIYVDADGFFFPGYVGLGPLHAMCYDLIPFVIDREYHGPEFSYLNNANSYIFPNGITPKQFAESVLSTYEKSSAMIMKRSKIWESIKHLTITNMAMKFNQGIESVIIGDSIER